MKTPKWTKTDAKRAEKMGFAMLGYLGTIKTGTSVSICREGLRFKSDDEAIEWVIKCVTEWIPWEHESKTCRKALHLCAKG